MILVDSSVWIDHFRRGNAQLSAFLEQRLVIMHPMVCGELACGNLRDRRSTIRMLEQLPSIMVAGDDEALRLIEHHRLMGRGLGWIDVHLLASSIIDGTPLWTLDRVLEQVAKTLGQSMNV